MLDLIVSILCYMVFPLQFLKTRSFIHDNWFNYSVFYLADETPENGLKDEELVSYKHLVEIYFVFEQSFSNVISVSGGGRISSKACTV